VNQKACERNGVPTGGETQALAEGWPQQQQQHDEGRCRSLKLH